MRRSYFVAALVVSVLLCTPAGAGNTPSARADPVSGPPGGLVILVGSCGRGLVGETTLPVFFHQDATSVALTPGVGTVDGVFGPQAATVVVPVEANAGTAQFEIQCPQPVGSLFVDFTVTSPSAPPPTTVTSPPIFTG